MADSDEDCRHVKNMNSAPILLLSVRPTGTAVVTHTISQHDTTSKCDTYWHCCTLTQRHASPRHQKTLISSSNTHPKACFTQASEGSDIFL